MTVRFAKRHTIRIDLSKFQYQRLKALKQAKGGTFSDIITEILTRTREFK